jgi:hypothetical protein
MKKLLSILFFLSSSTLLYANVDSFLEGFNKNEINYQAPSRVYNSNYSSQTLQTIEMNDRFDELYDQQQKLILMQQQRAEDERHRLKTERINSLRYNGYNAAYPVMRQGIDTKKPWQTYKQPKARPVRSVVPAPW